MVKYTRLISSLVIAAVALTTGGVAVGQPPAPAGGPSVVIGSQVIINSSPQLKVQGNKVVVVGPIVSLVGYDNCIPTRRGCVDLQVIRAALEVMPLAPTAAP